MAANNQGVTVQDIAARYPDVVQALNQAFDILPKTPKYYSRKYSFTGRYVNRKLTWERIFETLVEAGIEYEIKICCKS